MSDFRKISNLKTITPIRDVVNKLLLSKHLENSEKQFLLSLAILLIKQYHNNSNYKTAFEFAYFIVLKYALLCADWLPLYDLSVNFGFYPISSTIVNNKGIDYNITTETLTAATETLFKNDGIIETREQNLARNQVLSADESYISYVAPTSFGKSKLIVEHIKQNIRTCHKIAVIVPTKSLLMQTYKNIKKAFPAVRVLIHDEMYNEHDQIFISVLTQERALRLLEKHTNTCFDALYIDEAHKLLENTDRSRLLVRLVRLSKQRNRCIKILYLSPLIQDSKNLSLPEQVIREYKITFNIKQPILYKYTNTGQIFIYNRFFNELLELERFSGGYLKYIEKYSSEKNFIYLYTPRKIEYFAKKLFESISQEVGCREIEQVINTLNKYVHKDFYVSKYLKKGIIYIHGKMPDDIKDYLEFKFNGIKQIKYLIANNVILEGINLPFDSLFIVDAQSLNKNSLINLIGRVNRLNMVFTDSINDLSKLMPAVHFVENSGDFYRFNMENKIKLLQTTDFKDVIKNPLLDRFNIENERLPEKRQKIEDIVNEENFLFEQTNNDVLSLKKDMLKLGLNTIYNLSDSLCAEIYARIKANASTLNEQGRVFDVLNQVFVQGLETSIQDEEFRRLKNEKTRNYYYKLIIRYRRFSLKKKIYLTAKYLYRVKRLSQDPFLYIGTSYGECSSSGSTLGNKNFYIDLRRKNYSDVVNLSIIKIKLEEDFISFKLNRFFQLMLDYSLISQQLYNELIYSTNDPLILSLSKLGLNLNIINQLHRDGQLNNLFIDSVGNLKYNEKFSRYKEIADDFFRFELNKFLP